MTPPIKGFFGPYRWLSNFYPVEIEWEGLVYRSVEHAYQAAKFYDVDFRQYIQSFIKASNAKKAARLRSVRPDWQQVKLDIMYELTLRKFQKEPLRSLLLATENAYLEETNTWNDTFWGVCNGVGENNLGEILMLVRHKLR
jgi:ribA/ribD-fused uncharacterized protein